MWSGNCWWCDNPDHKQPDCAAFKKAVEKNGGSKKGLEGAYKKAKKLWLEKQKKDRPPKTDKPHLKPLTTVDGPLVAEHHDTEDESSSDDDSTIFSPLITVKPKKSCGTPATHLKQALGTPARNTFAPLGIHDDADDEEETTSIASQLGTWAHYVKVKKGLKTKARTAPKPIHRAVVPESAVPHDHYSHALRENREISAHQDKERPVKYLGGSTRKLSKEDHRLCKALAEHHRLLEPRHMSFPAAGLQVSNEKELDEALKSHSYLMNALPQDRKKIMKAARKAPGDSQLGEGECWALMDSGAGVAGINVKQHCPHLLDRLREAKKKKRCIMADGGELIVDKVLEVDVELDGFEVHVKFSDLPVQCPILSVRRIVKQGNIVVFKDRGGYILHKHSGRRIHFIEREGVYFVKMKLPSSNDMDVDPKSMASSGDDPMSGLTRPEP